MTTSGLVSLLRQHHLSPLEPNRSREVPPEAEARGSVLPMVGVLFLGEAPAPAEF